MLYEIHPDTTCAGFFDSIITVFIAKHRDIFPGTVNCIGLKKRNEIAFVKAIDQKSISISDQ